MIKSARDFAAIVSAVLLSSCGKSAAPPVVPADLRDVERAGEGLVSTTFGEAPGREPLWDRATIILGILHQVWDSAKAKNPGLPSMQVKMLDDAVARLDVAVPAKNKKEAVVASNLV